MEGAAGPAIHSAPDDRGLAAGADLEKPYLGYLIVTAKARFVEPMLLQRCADLPEGSAWLHELKLDGFRAIAFKSAGKVYLRSRNDKDFNARYPEVVKALSVMPDETVIDGEIVALD